MLIYVNITERQTDRKTHQKYSSEPHNIKNLKINKNDHDNVLKVIKMIKWSKQKTVKMSMGNHVIAK